MKLNDKTFLLYAAKHYDNPHCLEIEEFYEDLKRFQYLKRLFNKYIEKDDLKERLILNHIMILYNCFGKSATDLLFFKLKDYHRYLKPFVLFLNYMPEKVQYENVTLYESDIEMDTRIIETLRKI